jgi:hypothetical protein
MALRRDERMSICSMQGRARCVANPPLRATQLVPRSCLTRLLSMTYACQCTKQSKRDRTRSCASAREREAGRRRRHGKPRRVCSETPYKAVCGLGNRRGLFAWLRCRHRCGDDHGSHARRGPEGSRPRWRSGPRQRPGSRPRGGCDCPLCCRSGGHLQYRAQRLRLALRLAYTRLLSVRL